MPGTAVFLSTELHKSRPAQFFLTRLGGEKRDERLLVHVPKTINESPVDEFFPRQPRDVTRRQVTGARGVARAHVGDAGERDFLGCDGRPTVLRIRRLHFCRRMRARRGIG